jgi:hypothetical protein
MEKRKSGAKALLYALPQSSEKGAAIRAYLQEQGISILTATPMDSGRTLGAIFGLTKGSMGKATPLPKEPVLVMHHFSEEEMDALLDFLRETAPVALKAVTTQVNLRWTLGFLCGQLMRERAQAGK